jgi:sulfur carrier protein
MRVTVNGEAKQVPDGTTIAALIEQLKLVPRNVAVELNRRLVRSEKYSTALSDGDVVEIVTFVGGG